jgi:hypothetical protein
MNNVFEAARKTPESTMPHKTTYRRVGRKKLRVN